MGDDVLGMRYHLGPRVVEREVDAGFYFGNFWWPSTLFVTDALVYVPLIRRSLVLFL